MDFDARVPIPISVFPSSYREADTTEQTNIKVEGGVDRSQQDKTTRFAFAESQRGPRTETRYREEDRSRRPATRDETVRREEDVRIYDDRRGREDIDLEIEQRRYNDRSFVEKDRVYDREYRTTQSHPSRHHTAIDLAERDYRQRTFPGDEEIVEQRYEHPRDSVRFDEKVTIDEPRDRHRDSMGYYDEDGRYHSFRHGLARAAERAGDRIAHPIHGGDHHHHHEEIREEEVDVEIPSHSRGHRSEGRYVERSSPRNTITIPCHHVRMGDLLILQGRPCQVIRITMSSQTGQYRYLGVDLFTKQLQEESSFVSNPSPSVIVQNMLGPVFKQYRVLDMRQDGRVVAMTETGDVKQGLPVLDQSSLWPRLNDAFANGRGSVRVLVINDAGRELAVDYKVIHGARL
ncbi:MAG: hypothetical protein M1828_000305 [Chrysothrix sp. TS-e1954]|nr:MAG: hypothetical protein M1828_000305 [Chrysothrix sp. TS-e1954]